jgi:nitrite reductase (cytochrome c-552)
MTVLAVLLGGAAIVGVFGVQESDPAASAASLTETTVDPAVWGKVFPAQYEGWQRTSERTGTKYGGGGSDALAADRLTQNPQLKTIYAGYAFGVDYRARRGHAYMLSDQRSSLRVKAPFRQTGACLQCHASNVVAYRQQGVADGAPGTLEEPLTGSNGYAQLFKGFEKIGKMSYGEATKRVEHPTACIDCHDPKTQKLRVTRPAFIQGIRAFATSQATAAQFTSIEKWRSGDRKAPYDPNTLASRDEMRSFVCGQCHAEYYCGSDATLFYPWNNGLKADDIESYYNAYKFPGGRSFSDWRHEESGAEVLKAQHPEFELWSQGIHSRMGVSCADCHMPTQETGEKQKISSHWVRSPLLTEMEACQNCHQATKEEILERVSEAQEPTHKLLTRTETAVADLIRAIAAARARGVEEMQLMEAREFQRAAQWRMDFILSENSMGFHASAEAGRLLGEAMDMASRGRMTLQNAQGR